MNQILFWSSYSSGESLENWLKRSVGLFPQHFLTLESHKRLNNTVYLYTYQNLNTKGIPDNVEIKDANELYPFEKAWEALLLGHSIAHISDLVRFKAASLFTGAVMDMDAVVLREFPEEGFFCSSPAKLTGAFAPKWGNAHPPLFVSDNSWDGKALSDFPVGIDSEMKEFSNHLVDLIDKTLREKPKTGSEAWCFVMWEIQKYHSILTNKRVYEPIYFSPLPSWLPKGQCYSLEHPTRLGKKTLFGYRLPSIEEILSTSFCVKHTFDSAYRGVNYYKEGFWNTVHDDSLLGREAKFVLGEHWRKVLLDK